MRAGAARGLLAALLAVGAGCGPTDATRRLAMGEPCVPGEEGAICADGLCVSLDDVSGFCTGTCLDTCPDGFFCQAAGRYGRICKKLTGCKVDLDCPAGHVCNPDSGHCYVKVSRDLCAPCTDALQCPVGGACYTAISSREQFCTGPCGAGGACPTGYECLAIPAGKDGALLDQCVPVAQTCNAGRPLCSPCKAVALQAIEDPRHLLQHQAWLFVRSIPSGSEALSRRQDHKRHQDRHNQVLTYETCTRYQ